MIKDKTILSIFDLKSGEIEKIINLAILLKKEAKRGNFPPFLKNKVLGMLFQKPSTRTRVSFEVAMLQLGGHAINLSTNELQLSRGETIEDTAKTLSRYVDIIMLRVYDHNDLVKFADSSSVPVINGLSNYYHPVQILADMQTLYEVKGKLKGLKIAWIGDGNNVCNTWIIGSSLMGINISIATPDEYRPLKDAVKKAFNIALKTGSKIELTNEPIIAAEDADCIITDSIVSMGADKEREERLKIFIPKYQVNQNLFNKAKSDAIFMHCLPAKRGEEVVADIIDGDRSFVWEEAENRLHSQKSLLSYILLNEAEILEKTNFSSIEPPNVQ